MVKISWTLQSLSDIESIAEFISRDAPNYAKLLVQNIFTLTDKLREFPEMGRIVPEVNIKNIREIINGNYRIVYRIEKDEIEILTIHHSSRLLKPKNLN